MEKKNTGLAYSFRGAGDTAGQALSALRRDVFIVIYPIFVFLIALITLPVINGLILAIFNGAAHHTIFSFDEQATKTVFYYVAVLATALYTALIISIFTCVVSAAVLAELDEHDAPFLEGLRLVFSRLTRICRFGVLSIPFVFIPVGIFAQRKRLFKEPIAVIGSSITLSMAQLAPAILSENKSLGETIRQTTSTLGKAWHEGLVLKGLSYLLLILLAFVSLLPKIISSDNSANAKTASWLVSVVVFLGFLIVTKVLGAVFTATLYWRVTTNQGKSGKLLN